jgi:phenylpropionate dioxygenase-like ring-hydroxylating dioxygenase large terminal subunit
MSVGPCVYQVRENMLWVWGESGSEAFIHSAMKTPAVTQELESLPADVPVYHIGTPYSRDLSYDYTTLVENFLVYGST